MNNNLINTFYLDIFIMIAFIIIYCIIFILCQKYKEYKREKFLQKTYLFKIENKIKNRKIFIILNKEYNEQGKPVNYFIGKECGRKTRIKYGLDYLDRDKNKYIIKIPENTTSINPSFFRGMFTKSMKRLGSIENFNAKYSFDYSNLSPELQHIIEDNIKVCIKMIIGCLLIEKGAYKC